MIDPILLESIASSIDDIKTRIAEDERNRRLQDEAARQSEAKEGALQNHSCKGKAPATEEQDDRPFDPRARTGTGT